MSYLSPPLCLLCTRFIGKSYLLTCPAEGRVETAGQEPELQLKKPQRTIGPFCLVSVFLLLFYMLSPHLGSDRPKHESAGVTTGAERGPPTPKLHPFLPEGQPSPSPGFQIPPTLDLQNLRLRAVLHSPRRTHTQPQHRWSQGQDPERSVPGAGGGGGGWARPPTPCPSLCSYL